jgi:diguanylate cyclase (GGDEF)-like protein
MPLDIRTLFVLLAMICSLIGLMFLIVWLRNRAGGLYLRAGSAALTLALALLLTRGSAPDWLSIDVANALLVLGFAIAWSAVRLFDRRRTPLLLVFAGSAIWLAAGAIPSIHGTMANRIALVSLLTGIYSFACAFEFRRGRDEALSARNPLALLCFTHGLIVVFRAAYALVSHQASMFNGDLVQSVLMAEPALMVVAATLLSIGLVRERAENELRRSAETDELTGALNRRALFSGARRLINDTHRQGRPAAILLFDLDRFKLINDEFGHPVGDRVLRAFARVAIKAIRADDLFGRLGGEEFAAVLAGVDGATAQSIADRIRIDFSRHAAEHAGVKVNATVSAGVVVVGKSDELDEALALADSALYEAKREGRDRVRRGLAPAG